MSYSVTLPRFGGSITLASTDPKMLLQHEAEVNSMKSGIIYMHNFSLRDDSLPDAGITGQFSMRTATSKKTGKTFEYFTFWSDQLSARIDLGRTDSSFLGFFVPRCGTLPNENGQGGYKGFSNFGANGRQFSGLDEQCNDLIQYLQRTIRGGQATLLEDELQRLGVGTDTEKYIHAFGLFRHLQKVFSSELRDSGYWDDKTVRRY